MIQSKYEKKIVLLLGIQNIIVIGRDLLNSFEFYTQLCIDNCGPTQGNFKDAYH